MSKESNHQSNTHIAKPSYRSLLGCLKRLNVAAIMTFSGWSAKEIREQPIMAALKRASDHADRIIVKTAK